MAVDGSAADGEASDGGTLAGLHRMHLGSHLLVIDDVPTGMWRVERQRELLLHRGACVQVEVSFDASSGGAADLAEAADGEVRQTYLLEADVPGALLSRPGRGADGREGEEELAFMVADLNGMSGGRFWGAATRVPSLIEPAAS